MIRYVLTNRWFLGGCGLLILLSIGCYFWYQNELDPYKQEVEEANQQLETSQKTDTDSKTEPAADVAPVESITPTIEKPTTETSAEAAEDVRVSPYGFGPYPEIPPDFPEQRLFSNHYGTAEAELLDRVRVKLWKEGIRPDGIGWLQSTGLYYPTVRGTIYVRWGEFRGKKYITRLRSHPADHFDITKYRFKEDIPSHLKVLDFSEGIDPYEYLGLSKEADE